MLRNITVAQKCAQGFFKCDALARTNQIMHDCLFCMAQKTFKKVFSQDLKLETKILGTFFRFYIVI